MDNIDAIDALLSEELAGDIQPHEFTGQTYVERAAEKGVKIKRKAAVDKLTMLVTTGELKCRKVVIGGRVQNAYSKP